MASSCVICPICFEALDLVLVELLHLVGALVDRALALAEGLVALFQFLGTAIQLGAALVLALGLLAQLDAAFLDLGLGRLHDLGGALAGLRVDQASLLVGHAQDVIGLVLLVPLTSRSVCSRCSR